MQLPSAWQAQADTGSVAVRCKPLRDAASSTTPCARCQSALPPFNAQGDVCPACGAHIHRCFATFLPLPLVEFELAAGISEEQAHQLLAELPASASGRCLSNATLCGPHTGCSLRSLCATCQDDASILPALSLLSEIVGAALVSIRNQCDCAQA